MGQKQRNTLKNNQFRKPMSNTERSCCGNSMHAKGFIMKTVRCRNGSSGF